MNKKVNTIILLSIPIILFLMIFTYFLLEKNDKFTKLIKPSEQLENVTGDIDDGDAVVSQIMRIEEKYKNIVEEKDQKIKIDNEIYELLMINKDSNLCAYFNNPNSIDLCYKIIAQENLDKQLCDNIVDTDSKKECKKSIDFTLAVNNKDLLFCYNLDNSIDTKNCLSEIVEKMDIQPNDCDQIPLTFSNTQESYEKRKHENELRDECKAMVLLKLAKQKEDISLCNDIPLYYKKALCFGYFEKISMSSDMDNDGLIFVDEYRYRTDPNNPDTDNDGYNDGDEVAQGYDPNGKGKLYSY